MSVLSVRLSGCAVLDIGGTESLLAGARWRRSFIPMGKSWCKTATKALCNNLLCATLTPSQIELAPLTQPHGIVLYRRNVLDGRTMIEQLSELERRSDPVAIELAGVWTSSYAVVSVCRDEMDEGKQRSNHMILFFLSHLCCAPFYVPRSGCSLFFVLPVPYPSARPLFSKSAEATAPLDLNKPFRKRRPSCFLLLRVWCVLFDAPPPLMCVVRGDGCLRLCWLFSTLSFRWRGR